MSQFQLYVSIFAAKSFFCKALNELPLVVVQNQQKITFLQQKIFTSIWGLTKIKNQKSKIKNQILEFCNLQSTIYNLQSKIKNQILEFCNQKSLISNLQSNYKPQISNLKSVFFYLFSILFLSTYSFSQEAPRKKIGLVLSGGGAKGLAHIGVLKVIEEAGIKIDFIGGTSMGAVIGGLYASGYNAHQIDSIFKATNFDELLRDFIPRSSKNFYEKRNDALYAVSLPFDKFKIGVPTAYSKGAYLYSLLNKLLYKERFTKDFNQLPIPFLCIATDIEKGKEVVLNQGYLPQAIMASATLPSLFSPIEIDGKLLVDGGVTNNYPIDEIRKLGADIIIGVDVKDDLRLRNTLKDATRIFAQISNLQMMERMQIKKEKTDIYIKPNITDFSLISFNEGDNIVKKGEEAAREQFSKLILLGNNSVDQKKLIVSVKDTLMFDFINIGGLNNYTRAYVLGKLRFRSKEKITYDDLKSGIDNLNATQNFSAINYTLNQENGIKYLDFKFTENPVKTFLKFGLHYDGLYKSAILFNLTQKKFFFKNDVVSLDVILGDNFRYNLDYYIDNGFYFSFGVKSRLNQFNRNVSPNKAGKNVFGVTSLNSINLDFSDFSNQAYLQTIFKQKFIVGGGLELKHIKITSSTVQNTIPIFENSDYLNFFGYLKYDSLDNIYFPKTGWYFNGDFQSFIYSSKFDADFEKYSIVKADFGFARKFIKKATVLIQTEGGFAIGEKTIPYFDFVMGGYGFNKINNFRSFYGYDFLSLSGDSYVKTALTFDYEFLKKNHLNFSANYANIGNNMFDNSKNWLKKPQYSGYALGYGLESIIGPIEIKYSWTPESSKGFIWFSVGFWF